MRRKHSLWQEREKRNLSTNRQKPAQLAEECFRSLRMGARRTPRSFPTESLGISSQMLGSTEEGESARTRAASLLPGPVNKCFHLLLPMSLTRLYSKHSALVLGWASTEMAPDQPVVGTDPLCQGP